MVLVTRTYLNDIDGFEDEVTTVRLALDKVRYEIDLSSANEARLRDKLTRFLDAATEVKPNPVAVRRGQLKPAPPSTRPDREQIQAIREWAKVNGHQVAERGRISTTIQEAFAAAHSSRSVEPELALSRLPGPSASLQAGRRAIVSGRLHATPE